MLSHGSSPSCLRPRQTRLRSRSNLQHADLELFADVDDFGRMAHALPGHVGDVQQAVDAAEVDERAVIGQVLDDALDDRAFLQALEHLLALDAVLALDHRAARDHHVVALAIELDDLELEFLALEVARVARPDARRPASPAGTRGRRWMSTVKPPLTLPEMRPVTISPASIDVFQLVPDHGALGFLARQHGLAEAVLQGFQRHLDGVADLDFELAGVVAELLDRHDAFGLQAGVDDDDVGADLDDDAADDGARLELGDGVWLCSNSSANDSVIGWFSVEHTGAGSGRGPPVVRLRRSKLRVEIRAVDATGALVCRAELALGAGRRRRPAKLACGRREAGSTAPARARSPRSIGMPVESRTPHRLRASGAPPARPASRSSRAAISCRRPSRLTRNPFCPSTAYSGVRARSSALAVRNTL